MMNIPLRLSLVLLVLLASSPLFAGDIASSRHKVAAGDSIRSLLLQYNCAKSMSDYSRFREAFATLNPGIFHSALLTPGAMVSVPVLAKRKPGGCLSFLEQSIVRVEFERGSGFEAVRIYLDGPVLPDVFTLKQTLPVRVVCDFDGVLPLAGLSREMACDGRLIRTIRIGHEDKPFKRARVVLDIEDSLVGKVDQEFFEQQSLFVLTVRDARN